MGCFIADQRGQPAPYDVPARRALVPGPMLAAITRDGVSGGHRVVWWGPSGGEPWFPGP